MIHPNTRLCWIDDGIGYGVFATAFIPAGTITYVEDALEIVIPPDDPRLRDEALCAVIEKYSYVNGEGKRVVSWDIAKYVNHCCHYNTISTGYGFEIAVRDIEAGEEITDEYAVFSAGEDLCLACGRPNCRGRIRSTDFDRFSEEWDATIRTALTTFSSVEQPLLPYMDAATREALETYLNTGEGYRSVASQRSERVQSF